MICKHGDKCDCYNENMYPCNHDDMVKCIYYKNGGYNDTVVGTDDDDFTELSCDIRNSNPVCQSCYESYVDDHNKGSDKQ